MDWLSFSLGLISAVVPSVAVLIAVSMAHKRGLEHAREQKRRDVRTEFLINAYRALERMVHISDSERPNKKELGMGLEQAIADIQLFGDDELAGLASKFAREFGEANKGDLLPLLTALRRELRMELGLGPYDTALVHLRLMDLGKI